MNYEIDIKPLEATHTDAQIVALLKSYGLTNNKIELATLRHTLNINGMMRKVIANNASEKWTGTVMNMQDYILSLGDSVDEVAAKDGIALWMSHITNMSNVYWDTTDVTFSAAFWSMVQSFADSPNMPTTSNFNEIVALGGGWKFADLTVEGIAELRASYNKNLANESRQQAIQQLQAEIENTYINPFENDGITTADEIRALIKGGL